MPGHPPFGGPQMGGGHARGRLPGGMRRFFGTDGVRGRVGEPPMTPAFVLALGRAAAAELGGPLVLGRDPRASGPMLEAALVAGLLAGGIEVLRLGVLPTPGVAYLTGAYRARAGAVISASHNPYHDNGVKFFGPGGKKLADEREAAIERGLEASAPYREGGRLREAPEGAERYLDHLLAYAPDLDGVRIVVDAANGAAHRLAPTLFARAGAEVFAIGTSPDGRNINLGLGATAPETMARLVAELGYDLGVAFDGDGDRVILADRRGRIVTGDHLLYLHARVAGEPAVVGTVMSNLGLERALEEAGIRLLRAPVGDRYVLEWMEREGVRLGAEPSGHMIFRDRFITGDGMLTALLTLAALEQSGTDLADWVEELSLYPQVIENVPVADKQRVAAHPRLPELLAEAERRLGDGRVNVRPSGTEPVVRVMVEGAEAEAVREVAAWLATRIRSLE